MDDDSRNECFRKYRNPEESWVDHSEFLVSRPRYASLFKLSKTDYKGWAKGLKKAGYATAPDYAQKLIKIIEEEELYQFDKPGKRNRKVPNELNYKLGDTQNYQSRVVYINNIPSIKVKEGDTFEGIARYFGIPLRRLLAYNDKNELSIREGMHVFLKKKKNKAAQGLHLPQVPPGGHDVHDLADIRDQAGKTVAIQLHGERGQTPDRRNDLPARGGTIILKGILNNGKH